MTKNRIILIVILITAISVFLAFDLGQYLTLEYFKSRQVAIDGYRLAHPFIAAAGFFVSYVAVTGLSLP
ncbi:MAG: TVP38/TMEM64 family protein, partial [Gammaproteobacteria bacterium]